MSAMAEAVAEAPAEGKEGSGRAEALRETYRAALGSEKVLEALDKVLGSLGTFGGDPPADAVVEAVLCDLDFLARHLGRIGSYLSPSRAWPGDDLVAERGTALSAAIARLAEGCLAELGLERRGAGADSAGLRETFAIRFGDEVGPRGLGRRHLELIVSQVYEAVAVANIVAPRPPRQSPLVRDLAAAEAELRHLARLAREVAEGQAGAGPKRAWCEVLDRLPAQLVALADQAAEGVSRA